MPWWVWIIFGAALLGSETIVDLQFYLLFPGVAALVIGAAGALGFEGQPWQEWLSFGVLSVIFLATFRGVREPGGDQAMQLRVAEQWVEQFGQLAKKGNTFVLPANMSDLGSMLALATGMLKGDRPLNPERGSPRA